jgi:cyclic pyranopterin phosphate synthase
MAPKNPTKDINMVDISEKPVVKRTATASGKIYLTTKTITSIKNGEIKKGDPLVVGEIAALTALKNTPQLIPLCHQIPITDVKFQTKITEKYIEVQVTVISIAQTGVEMEALVGVSTFLNNIWDMTKYLEKDTQGQYPTTKISDICVIEKIKEQK